MKKILFILFAALSAVVSCTSDTSDIENRLDNIENGLDNASARIAAIEAELERINGELKTLQYLKGGIVINNLSGSQADGWTLTLSNGEVVKVYPKDESSAVPVLSVSEDGYWMADTGNGNGPQYIHDASGARVPVTVTGGEPGADGKDGVTPLLGVDAEGYWTVSYDKGETYEPLLDAAGQRVRAQISVGDSIFNKVDKIGDTVVFTLHNGDVYTVPLVPDFACVIKDAGGEQEFESGQTRVFTLELRGVADAMAVCPDGWSAVVDGTSLSVTAPVSNGAVTGQVSVLATSANGFAIITKMNVRRLTPPTEYESYYEMWEAGENISIEGEVYNKATYTATPVHVTSDKTISSETGIYFVDPSATLTVTGWNPNRIIIGNSLTERSKLALNSHFFISGSQYLLLKNLDITLKHTDNAMFCLTTNAKLTISVDDCYIDNTAQKKPLFTYNAACENPVKLQIVNSEIEFMGVDNYNGTLAKLDANGKDASVVLKNTVLYVNGLNTDGRPYGEILLTGSSGSVLTDFTIDHCTFINVGKTGWKNMDMGGTIKSMTVTNNYGYTTSTATNYWIYFIGATEPASWTFSGNYSSVYNNAFCPQWGSEKIEKVAKVEDQFVSLNFATRNFKLETTEYGAQR